MSAPLCNQIVTVVGLVIVALALEPPLFNAIPEVVRFGAIRRAQRHPRARRRRAAGAGVALAVSIAWASAAFAAAAAHLRGHDLL